MLTMATESSTDKKHQQNYVYTDTYTDEASFGGQTNNRVTMTHRTITYVSSYVSLLSSVKKKKMFTRIASIYFVSFFNYRYLALHLHCVSYIYLQLVCVSIIFASKCIVLYTRTHFELLFDEYLYYD